MWVFTSFGPVMKTKTWHQTYDSHWYNTKIVQHFQIQGKIICFNNNIYCFLKMNNKMNHLINYSLSSYKKQHNQLFGQPTSTQKLHITSYQICKFDFIMNNIFRINSGSPIPIWYSEMVNPKEFPCHYGPFKKIKQSYFFFEPNDITNNYLPSKKEKLWK